MLKQRTITACILVILTSLLLFFAKSAIFAAGCWLMCLIAMFELVKMYRFNLVQTGLCLGLATGCALIIAALDYDISQIVRIITVTCWCFVAPLILLFTPRRFPKISIMLLALLIFVPAYYALNVLRNILGPWQLLSIMAVAWVADSGAYFVGRRFGKHKLAIKISPGKSIEGALGGFGLVVIYLLILKAGNWVMYLPNYASAFKFAAILTTVSIIGDLLESWFKRVAQVKDSGSLLPGHGGVFDRIDSLVAVVPIAFAIIRGMI